MGSSTFLPVETVLKIGDNELMIEETHKIEQTTSVSSANYVSKGTQCDWKTEQTDTKICNLFPITETKINMLNSEDLSVVDRANDEVPVVIRNCWPSQSESTLCPDQKIVIPATLPQQYVCNFQALPVDDKFFLQFDYKTRNKLKTKQRRLDPYYRSQERARQRTVMRIKRQDPRFRAAEREKGRYRMRLKRLDPVFRSQERERQRERMKLKRSNPDFREREREQQKTRLHVKRLDPAFKERERVQDRLRMQMKQDCNLYSTVQSEKVKTISEAGNKPDIQAKTFKHPIESHTPDLQNNQALMCAENFNARLFPLKAGEINMEPFHFKKQHILNFNFYNSTKEQWTQELYPKTVTHINVLEEEKLQSPVNENLYLKNNLILPKKTYLKPDIISQTLLNIKKEESNIDVGKQENSLTSDSSAITLFPLIPVSEK